jgi:23S rRNA (adenine2030-N6)-methyltransferase
MRIELLIQRPSDPERLNGCGLIVANPPYTLEGELAAILPDLSRRLAASGTGARHRLDWIKPAAPGTDRPSPAPKQRVRPRR